MTPISLQQAGAVAAEYYGVTAPVRLLPGEFDRNFELVPSQGDPAILKVSHPDTPDVQLDFENRLMAHLNGLPVPRIIRNLNGGSTTRLPSGARVRMLTRIPGQPLADASPRAPALHYEIGALLGRVDCAMQSFDHPGMHRDLVWDLTRAADVIAENLPFVHRLAADAVATVLRRFEERVSPVLSCLPAQLIHNDANDYNVLVVWSGESWKLSGLVDFGDVLYAPRVIEPAVAAAYAVFDEPDPLAVTGHIVSGYHRSFALLPEELEIVWDLVVSRLALSVAVASGRAASGSENPYHQVSVSAATTALAHLIAFDPDRACDRLAAALAA